ncbi:MAG: dTDP-4-dehydrorhamnose reductase [Parachlamydiaceae bacterium]|nr:dTDP-4-dehydrorhamnose reductase [Parachlamydiaceae bacterium]
MSNILLIGAYGQVGYELRSTLAGLGKVIACTRKELDLGDPDQISSQVRRHKPSIIVNAAAYTAVDRAESESEMAMKINGIAPGVLAEEAKRLNALLVHYSTDYVFDGLSKVPYTEEDAPNPINVYGQSKLTGEKNIQAVEGRHLILRTSWVYSPLGHNFLKTMLKLADSGKEISVVTDQVGAPTWSRFLAEYTAKLLLVLENNKDSACLCGLYHLTPSGSTSWFNFAKAIFAHQGKKPILNAITTDQYVSAAKRPLNSVLSSNKLINTFGMQLPSWEQGLEHCLKELNQRQ